MKSLHLHTAHSGLRHQWQLLSLICALLFTGQIFAQYELRKYAINNGAGVMTGDGYELKSSIGQVDAGEPMSEGHGISSYSLNGGFWQQNTDLIFKNNFK